MGALNKDIEFRVLKVRAQSDDFETSAVNLANWDGVLFLVQVELTAEIVTIDVQQKDDGGTFRRLKDARVTPAENNQLCWIDVYRPRAEITEDEAPEFRLDVDMAGNNFLGAIYAIKYRGRTKPCANIVAGAAGVLGVEVISPEIHT